MSTTGLPIFDAIAARQAAIDGITKAEKRNPSLLEFAKQKAIELGRRQATVTADDVQRALLTAGYGEHELGNAAGSVFRNKKVWQYTGRTVQSERVSSHGRLIRVWRYLGS